MGLRMKLARLGDGAEVFHTLQGEGAGVGIPAVFVRLSRCNLHCVWCDTDHTWNFQGTPWTHEKDAEAGYTKHRKEDVTIEMDAADLAAVVRKYGCKRVVLTGGEPLLQQQELSELICELRGDGQEWYFEMETNGTMMPNADILMEVSQFNVSPKLANSGMRKELRLKADVLQKFAQSGKAWFKFVICREEDVAEVFEMVNEFQLPIARLILMPEGRNVEELDKVAAWLAERCRDLNIRFSDRLHVRLWGDTRGT